MLEIIQTQLAEGILIYPVLLAIASGFVLGGYHLVTKIILPKRAKTNEKEFDELLSDAGYEYDPSRDIFVTKMNSWQREVGYCRLYDEACPALSLIVDTEPIYFDYKGKHWMIQFWKGQYYLNTGCEIGVYNTTKPEIDIPELFTGNFYDCVSKEDMLDMAFTLYKNGEMLFYREEKHWWLTGFKTGEFSEPEELSVRFRITFKDPEMCQSFISAMLKAGYYEQEIITNGITVEFMFDRPHTEQPFTRTAETDWIMQRYNEHNCKLFQEITAGCYTWPEKLKAIQEREPYLFNAVVGVGKTREVFKAFLMLHKYLKHL